VTLDVAFTPSEIEGVRLEGRTVIVMDVLRATSTIVESLSNGARAVIPVDTVERAVRTAADLGADAVLCGERDGVRIDGFDYGNSPREFGRGVIEGRTLVMSTTNGTRALLAAARADAILVGCLLNADAVAAAAAADASDVLLLCAGRKGRFAMEDAVCAGVIGRRIAERVRIDPTDAARAAIVLAGRDDELAEGLLHTTDAAESLRSIGLGDDVEFCGVVDRYDAVPRLRDHRITL
jgi:2-phosphosulfolactate phosphatase